MKSLRISTEEYHPPNGDEGNCNPPASSFIPATDGRQYH